jgi:hypothetical protein
MPLVRKSFAELAARLRAGRGGQPIAETARDPGSLGGPERLLGGLLRLLQLTESIQTPQKAAAGRGCDLAVIGCGWWLRLGLQLGFCLDFRGFSWLRLVAAVQGE